MSRRRDTRARLCDRCAQARACDGPPWCLGFIDYKRKGELKWKQQSRMTTSTSTSAGGRRYNERNNKMNRREFIRGVAAVATASVVPEAVAALPFEDIAPDHVYAVKWNWGGTTLFHPYSACDYWDGSILADVLVANAELLNPDSPKRDMQVIRPVELQMFSSGRVAHTVRTDDAWFREFYRRHR